MVIINYLIAQTFFSRAVGYTIELAFFLLEFVQELPIWHFCCGCMSCFFNIKKRSWRQFRQEFRLTRPKYSHIYSYALNLTIFQLILTYSHTIPLILPFGVIYYFVSLFTDRILLIMIYRRGWKLDGYNIMRKTTYVILFYLIVFSTQQSGILSYLGEYVVFISIITTGIMVVNVLLVISCIVLCFIPRCRKVKDASLEDGEFTDTYRQPFYRAYTKSIDSRESSN